MKELNEKTMQFAQTYVAPHSDQTDKEGAYPIESFTALKKEGYMGLIVPEAYGGQGLNLHAHATVIQALAQSCATTALCYMMHNVATMCVVLHGSDKMKEALLPKIAKGEISLALAFSETGTGTHFYQPEIALSKKNENYILNGKKSFVTAAGFVDYYMVLSSTLKKDGLDNWLVPDGSKGVTFQASQWDGLGMRGNASMPMYLENVTLDENDRVGAEGSGVTQVFEVVAPFFITGLAAVYTGVALHINDIAVAYSMDRKYSDGKSLSEIPTVQNHLAQIYKKAQGAKHFTTAASLSGSNMDADALTQIIAARVNASDVAVEVATLAMKIGGGAAYAKRLPLERLLRDALAAQVMAPSTDVLSIWLGKALTNQPIP